MNTETVANVLHLGDNKPYPSDQRFIYRINFAAITTKMLKYTIPMGHIALLMNDM